MGESIPITANGRKIVEKKLADQEAQIPGIRKAIGEAREKGDLNENAEYQAAMEKLRMVEAQVNDLRSKLIRSQIVDPRRAPKDKVAFGAMVTILDLDTKKKETLELVGFGEDDPAAGKILSTSPVGQGLLLKKVGEKAEFEVPRGQARYKVLKIEYPS